MISVYGESHILRPVSQKEADQGKRNQEDKKREYEKCKWPITSGDQILNQRDKEKRAESDANTGQAIGHPSLFLKPVRNNRSKRRDAEEGDSNPCDQSEIDIEVEKRFNLCAEEKTQAHQKNSGKHHFPRAHPVDQVTDHRGCDHID